MKTKVFVITDTTSGKISGVYSSFEVALKMSKAFQGVRGGSHTIQPTDFDFIDWEIIAEHIEKKVLDRVGSS